MCHEGRIPFRDSPLSRAGLFVLSTLIMFGSVARQMGASSPEASLIPTSQRESLIALYNSTNGDGWTDNSGWKTPPLDPDGFALPGTEGSWHGVTVDSVTQTVTGIDLSGDNLAGTLPAELGNLTSLTNLNLSSNPLTGSIPAEIGNLTSLQYFYLDYCQLTGVIPTEIGSLTALRELRLIGNRLTGSIPAEIGNMTALQEFHLSENQLTGSIPATLGNLTGLQGIYANNNQLSGSIPAVLGDLPKLTYLYLHTNQLSGPIPTELGRLSKLRYVSLYENALSGSIPPELGNLVSLRSIILRHNQLSGEIPAALGNLTSLTVLRLGENQLSGKIPAALGNLVNLTSLRLKDNRLSGEIPSSLGNLTQLTELLLYSNKLTGPVPTSFMNLTALTATNIGYNGLYTSDQALAAFLTTKDSDWASTQTIAPTGVAATSLNNAVITVSWLPVTYTADAGYFKVLISQTSGGPYTLAGQTANKATVAVNVAGLTPGTRYYFVVQTVTNVHADNENIVESDYSTEASAVAWLQPVQITGTITLGGAPLAGVVMNGLPAGTVTNALGVYSVSVSSGWSGTVTPTIEGYTFDPDSRHYTSVTAGQTGQDYAAAVSAAGRKADFLGTWTDQGVYYRNPDTEEWVPMASPASMIAAGDLDGDGIDDLIGIWPSQGGVWVKYSKTGSWDLIASTASWIACGDMNCDGRDDLIGIWPGQGTFYRDSVSGSWVLLASEASEIACGDLDGDGCDDLIGIWPDQGGVWVRYHGSGTWERIASTADWIACGDMNGDGRDDLVGSWSTQGVYHRNSITGEWVLMATPATMVAVGDLDGDGTDDLLGIWPSQGGVWIKYGNDSSWAYLASTADWITAGYMRPTESLAPDAAPAREGLPWPMGGNADGPNLRARHQDLSSRGPGGKKFVYVAEKDLSPRDEGATGLMPIPGPGESGFTYAMQERLIPQEMPKKDNRREVKRVTKKT